MYSTESTKSASGDILNMSGSLLRGSDIMIHAVGGYHEHIRGAQYMRFRFHLGIINGTMDKARISWI